MANEIIRRLKISGPDTSATVELPPGTYRIGRQSGNEVHLNNGMVSRQHAKIDSSEKGCQITDLGSANGTAVNDEPLEANNPRTLVAGDVIQIGPFELVFEQLVLSVEPEEKPAKPEPKPKPKAEPKPKPKPKPKPEPEPEPPAPPPPPPPMNGAARPEPDYSKPPPGLSKETSSYLTYLPGIYQTDFMARFLAIFESILSPIEWTVDNFDIMLDPRTAPSEYLPWLASWFSVTFDATWTEEQQRLLLAEAHQLFARRGTHWALSRLLEIYLGEKPEIDDLDDKADPFTFTVKIPLGEDEVDRELIERMVDASKPAHTSYSLLFKQSGRKRSKGK